MNSCARDDTVHAHHPTDARKRQGLAQCSRCQNATSQLWRSWCYGEGIGRCAEKIGGFEVMPRILEVECCGDAGLQVASWKCAAAPALVRVECTGLRFLLSGGDGLLDGGDEGRPRLRLYRQRVGKTRRRQGLAENDEPRVAFEPG